MLSRALSPSKSRIARMPQTGFRQIHKLTHKKYGPYTNTRYPCNMGRYNKPTTKQNKCARNTTTYVYTICTHTHMYIRAYLQTKRKTTTHAKTIIHTNGSDDSNQNSSNHARIYVCTLCTQPFFGSAVYAIHSQGPARHAHPGCHIPMAPKRGSRGGTGSSSRRQPVVSGTSGVLQELRTQLKANKAFGSNFEESGPHLSWHRTLQAIALALAIQFSELRVCGVRFRFPGVFSARS